MRFLLGSLLWALPAAECLAQVPAKFPRGSKVKVVVGKGTSLKPGRRLRGSVTLSNSLGLGFTSKRGTRYFLLWEHMRTVNDKSIAQLNIDRSGPNRFIPPSTIPSYPALAKKPVNPADLPPPPPARPKRTRSRKPYVAFYAGAKASNKESKAGILAGIDLYHAVNPYLSMGPGFLFNTYDNKANTMSLGSVTMAAVLGKLRLHTCLKSPLQAYLEGGAGFAVMNRRLDPSVNAALSLTSRQIVEKLGNVPTFTYGGGIQFAPSPTFTLGAWANIQVLRPKLTTTTTNITTLATTVITAQVPLNSLNVGLAVSTRF